MDTATNDRALTVDEAIGIAIKLPRHEQCAAAEDIDERILEQRPRLAEGEPTTYLSSMPDTCDVIVSADTLVYFGPLEEVVAAAAGASKAGGPLVFTVEDSAAAGSGYTISPHGRYSHTRPYAERVLAAAGLYVEIAGAELRLAAGIPVDRLFVNAVKPVAAGMRHA